VFQVELDDFHENVNCVLSLAFLLATFLASAAPHLKNRTSRQKLTMAERFCLMMLQEKTRRKLAAGESGELGIL